MTRFRNAYRKFYPYLTHSFNKYWALDMCQELGSEETGENKIDKVFALTEFTF